MGETGREYCHHKRTPSPRTLWPGMGRRCVHIRFDAGRGWLPEEAELPTLIASISPVFCAEPILSGAYAYSGPLAAYLVIAVD